MKANSGNPNPGRAVPFVIYQNKKFIVTDEAREILSEYDYKNIGIISLVGKYRTGKSFLLNRVLLNQKKENGFDVGPTIKPCTKGIWMWSQPMYIENNHCKEKFPVFMIDTEGLGAYDEEINHDSKIFLIAILISSLFILNSFGNIDENAINSLSFVLNLSNHIKLRENDNHDHSDLAKYFPSLLWLLRDFSLKLEDNEGNTITAKQYMENALQLQKGSSEVVDQKNKVRKMIQTYFSERDCFSMVRPVEEEKDLQNLQTLDNSRIRPEFLEQAEILRNKVSKKVRPKIFNNKPLTGNMLVELLKSILDSINQGLIPVIENSWKYVVHNEGIKFMNDVLIKYTTSINKFKEENKENPNFFVDLGNYNKQLETNLIDEFASTNIADEVNEYILKVQEKFKEEFKKFNEENSRFFENRMTEGLEKNSKKIIETFDTEKYTKNYYQFFQDLENLKEITEASVPDFPMKKEIIFEKIIQIVKKFIEMTFLKNKILNEKELVSAKNEVLSLNNKINLKNEECERLKTEIKEINDKHKEDIKNLKTKEKSLEENLSKIENEKKNLNESFQKKTNEHNKQIDDKNEQIRSERKKLENEIKQKDDEIMKLKFAEEKASSLTTLKIQFLEKEVNDNKERLENYKKDINEYKNIIDEQNQKIDQLRDECNKKEKDNIDLERKFNQISYSNSNLNRSHSINIHNNTNARKSSKDIPQAPENQPNASTSNNNLPQLPNLPVLLNLPEDAPEILNNSVLNNQQPFTSIKNPDDKSLNLLLENSKLQIDESKKIHELITTLKTSIESNNSNYNNNNAKLEEKITKLKNIKEIVKSALTLQCRICAKLFTYEIFLTHTKNCCLESVTNSIDNTKPIRDKLKIKILKGILNKDELGKPFIEYILEISYNTQTWRVNKKFNNFANLHKTLKSLHSDVNLPESANIFHKISMSSKDSNNFHENKIKLLEDFLKDISDIPAINRSKVFRKFFDFDDYIDEDGIPSLVNRGMSSPLLEENIKEINEISTSNFDIEKEENNTNILTEEVVKKTEESEKTDIIYKKKKSLMENKNKIVTMNVNLGSKEKSIKVDTTLKNDKKTISPIKPTKPASKIRMTLHSHLAKDKEENTNTNKLTTSMNDIKELTKPKILNKKI